jgi:epsilon-lactone hydrolase
MPSPLMQMYVDALLEQRAAGAGEPAPPIAESRAEIDRLAEIYPMPADVVVTPVDAGGVPAQWLEPPGGRAGTVLYLHGGGYQTGSVRSHGELAARIGRAAGADVLIVDYRLAPEHVFPAALDDALAAWRWLRTVADVPARSLAVAGDSAGGGLAAALLVALRDAGEDCGAGAVLLSPWTDLACTGASILEREAEDPMIPPGVLEEMAALYLRGADPRDPKASPLYADLSKLPPLLVQVGTAEMLFSDAERLAAAAASAGVEVTLDVGEGLPHVYQLMADTLEAAEATVRIGEFMRSRWP